MLNPAQHARLARKCADAAAAAVDSLPQLLKDSEPEAAAVVVADILKSVLIAPLPEPDPAAALNAIVQEAKARAERRHAETKGPDND